MRTLLAAMALLFWVNTPLPYAGQGPVYNQGQTPYCVGYSLSLWASIEWDARPAPDPIALMAEAHTLDGFQHKSEMEPTTVQAGIAALIRRGLASSYHVTQDLRASLPLLRKEPLLVALRMYDMRLMPVRTAPPARLILPDWSAPSESHALIVYAYDPARDEVELQNSWGADWGDWGRARVGVATLQAMIDGDHGGGGVYEILLPVSHNYTYAVARLGFSHLWGLLR